MNEINEWEKEFPRLYKLKTPLTFLADTVIGTERVLRKVIFWGVVILMIYIIISGLNNFITGDLTTSQGYLYDSERTEYIKAVWKGYRNIFFLLWGFNSILAVISSIIWLVRKKYAKTASTMFGLLPRFLFITFSYVIAGMLIDLVFVGLVFHWNILKNMGLDVGENAIDYILR